MVGRQMRVAFDHHQRPPAAESLQLVRWRPRLAVPGCPGMPQIMPAEIFDAGTLQRSPPCPRVGMPERLPLKREYPLRMFTELPAQYVLRGHIERHGNRFTIFGLIRTHPGMTRLQIDA